MRDPRNSQGSRPQARRCILLPLLVLGLMPLFVNQEVAGQTSTTPTEVDPLDLESSRLTGYQEHVQPLLTKYCVACHNVDEMTSGVRVDNLDGTLQDRQLRLWEHIQTLLNDGKMPPQDERQPSADERRLVIDWIAQTLAEARSRPAPKNGAARRLTVTQFRNTLRDLLGIDDDLTEILPPDSITRDGFANNSDTLELSPLMLEAYFDIADQALQRCIVDENSRPSIQNFRVDVGRKINPEPCSDQLVLGANSLLLANEDFTVTQLTSKKLFEFTPFLMQTKYRFIEGYQGNDTVRGWRDYDSIYHAVFACMRGTEGYPEGLPYETIPVGLLLRPAIPSPEIFGQSSTYGPSANFKISLRELPDQGRFRVTVHAAKYDDGLLLESNDKPADAVPETIPVRNTAESSTVEIPVDGVYQVDAFLESESPTPDESQQSERGKNLSVTLGDRYFSGALHNPAFLAVRLSAGPLVVAMKYAGATPLERLVITPLGQADDITNRFVQFEQRTPRLGVHLGLRRDCGSTLSRVGTVQTVHSTESADFVFEGAIRNFPSPDVEKDNVNYLAGIREIGVRSEYTDGRDMPRLLIQSVEFEGPLYDAWPPAPHRAIFIDSPDHDDPAKYASEIIRSFAAKAFRRPITDEESESLVAVWQSAFTVSGDFRESVRDTLLIVLTSPQFLFHIENSASPAAEPLTSHELASKLSYFLWNTAPDQTLLNLAAAESLYASLDAETTRMIADPRFEQFTSEFVTQWLGLQALDVVELDRQRFPKLTRDLRSELRREPVEFVQHLIRHNLPLRNLIESDLIVANEIVADYYGLGTATNSGFEFVPITHQDEHLGGVLTQAAIMAGLSNGREPNPVKRGAWFARKIIAMPPDDPPPNVPALPEAADEHLTLRQKLERHRSQSGCAKCHAGIDPWGVPFESYDAAGLFRRDDHVDTSSVLPDSTEVADVRALRRYLVNNRLNQVAFSFLKHLATYAAGRDLSYNEVEFLRNAAVEWPDREFKLQDMTRFIIHSPVFLEK